MLVYFQEENDSLRCQLEAYKNEVDLVRSDLKTELEQKEKQLKMLQQTLQGMQQVGLEGTVYNIHYDILKIMNLCYTVASNYLS